MYVKSQLAGVDSPSKRGSPNLKEKTAKMNEAQQKAMDSLAREKKNRGASPEVLQINLSSVNSKHTHIHIIIH